METNQSGQSTRENMIKCHTELVRAWITANCVTIDEPVTDQCNVGVTPVVETQPALIGEPMVKSKKAGFLARGIGFVISEVKEAISEVLSSYYDPIPEKIVNLYKPDNVHSEPKVVVVREDIRKTNRFLDLIKIIDSLLFVPAEQGDEKITFMDALSSSDSEVVDGSIEICADIINFLYPALDWSKISDLLPGERSFYSDPSKGIFFILSGMLEHGIYEKFKEIRLRKHVTIEERSNSAVDTQFTATCVSSIGMAVKILREFNRKTLQLSKKENQEP